MHASSTAAANAVEARPSLPGLLPSPVVVFTRMSGEANRRCTVRASALSCRQAGRRAGGPQGLPPSASYQLLRLAATPPTHASGDRAMWGTGPGHLASFGEHTLDAATTQVGRPIITSLAKLGPAERPGAHGSATTQEPKRWAGEDSNAPATSAGRQPIQAASPSQAPPERYTVGCFLPSTEGMTSLISCPLVTSIPLLTLMMGRPGGSSSCRQSVCSSERCQERNSSGAWAAVGCPRLRQTDDSDRVRG